MHLWILCLTCLLAPSLRAAEPLLASGAEIVVGENDSDWQPLFTALASKGAVVSTFTEFRWFKLRKQPVEITGQMRMAPDRGLSLHYERDDRTVVVDAAGVLLRDARGRTRTLKPDDRAPAINTWLLPVLQFDLPTLQTAFRLYGAREGEAWRLDFVPRDAPAAEGVGTIIVRGVDEAVSLITLRPQAGLRIEITIGETQTGVTFNAADLERFFR